MAVPRAAACLIMTDSAGPARPITAAFDDATDAARARLAATRLAPVRLDCEGHPRPGLANRWSADTSARFWTLELAPPPSAAPEDRVRWTAAALAATWRSDPDAAPPGGESFSEIRQRVRPLMTDALSTYRGHTVVLVTHAAPSKMILTTALDVSAAVAYRMRVDTASLSGFTVEADGAVMVWAINETGHLMG